MKSKVEAHTADAGLQSKNDPSIFNGMFWLPNLDVIPALQAHNLGHRLILAHVSHDLYICTDSFWEFGQNLEEKTQTGHFPIVTPVHI